MALDVTTVPAVAAEYGSRSPQDILDLAFREYTPDVAISFSGAEDVVLIDMATRLGAHVRVFSLDTGRLHAETYRFIDDLVEKLELNLRVYQPRMSAAWLEARHGRLWEQGIEGIERYNDLRKTEPMKRALTELHVNTWFAGLRRDQSRSRRRIQPLEWHDGRWKVHPVFDWTDRKVFDYLRAHDLPYHPLWDEGYVSIGDWHTTRTLAEAGDAEATRFFGLKRECGIHGLEG